MKILIVGQGYIGSYLTEKLAAEGHDLPVCSTSFGLPDTDGFVRLKKRYQDLQSEVLASFDRILWFAGHSSVGQSVRDPSGAVRNNCFDLLEFARRRPSHVPLIYASTASLYSVSHDSHSNVAPKPASEGEALISSFNAYDSSKAAFDALVGPLAENTCGLRLGTVCGFSPMLRPELVFNAMNLSALRDGKVKVANAGVWRSLLFLEDLHGVIATLIRSGEVPARFMNVASVETQIGTLAEEIAGFHHAKVEVLPDSPTYSFRMSTDLMEQSYGRLPEKTMEQRCREFSLAFQHNK